MLESLKSALGAAVRYDNDLANLLKSRGLRQGCALSVAYFLLTANASGERFKIFRWSLLVSKSLTTFDVPMILPLSPHPKKTFSNIINENSVAVDLDLKINKTEW